MHEDSTILDALKLMPTLSQTHVLVVVATLFACCALRLQTWRMEVQQLACLAPSPSSESRPVFRSLANMFLGFSVLSCSSSRSSRRLAIIGSPNYHCCVGFVFFRFSMPPVVVVVVAIVVVGGGCGGVVVGVVGVVVVVVVNCCLCRYLTVIVDFSASPTCSFGSP